MGQEEEVSSSNGNPAMERLEDAIFEVASSDQSNPLTMEMIARIKAFLINESFNHNFHSPPDHPPYAEMIYKAIEELNKNGDYSNEAALSAYIKSEYNDNDNQLLPWAHESLLSHHLRRLSMKGEIIVAEDGCYTFPKLKRLHNNKHFHLMLLQQNKALLLLHNNNGDNDDGGGVDEDNEVDVLSIKPLKAVWSEGTWAAQDQDLVPKPIKQKGKRRKEKEKESKEREGIKRGTRSGKYGINDEETSMLHVNGEMGN